MRPLPFLAIALAFLMAAPNALAAPGQSELEAESRQALERALLFAPVLAREKAMQVVARASARLGSAGAQLDGLERALDRGVLTLERLEDTLDGQTDARTLLDGERLRRRIVRRMVAIRIERSALYAARPAMPNAYEELDLAQGLAGLLPELVDARERLDEQERKSEANYAVERRRDRAANGTGLEGRRGGRFANDRRGLLRR